MSRNFKAPAYGGAGPQALPAPKGAPMPMSSPKMAPQGAPMAAPQGMPAQRPQMPMRGVGFMRPGAMRR